jgi:hypothetical protein
LARRLVALALICCAAASCSRHRYRLEADSEVDYLIAEKSVDPRWALDSFTIEQDPRSRYFDMYDPDRQPMPEDDPSSHEFMHWVYGKSGWKKWHHNGERPFLENVGWEESLDDYVEVTDDGEVMLSLNSALDLAYMHAPTYQSQLETVYLSALDVSAERFRLDTQFFGGNDTTYRHLGRLATGGESNSATTATDAVARRRLATAGELLVGFANSFVWEFTGTDTNATSSLANFSLIQPLLRGAGRVVQLEQLTIVERNLLANLRAYERYRRGFYTNVAIGELGVSSPQRRGGFFGGTGLTGFTGTGGGGGFGGVGAATGFGRGGFTGGVGGGGGAGAGFAGGGAGTVGGFIGLLQQMQQIRNTEDSLGLQLRTLSLLEAYLDAGVIDLVQVDQFRQNIETERANLLQARNNLENSLDTFKTGTLGLPPNLGIELDETLIEQFQLLSPELTDLQNRVADYQTEFGGVGEQPTIEAMQMAVAEARKIRAAVAEQLDAVRAIVDDLDEIVPLREASLTPPEASLLRRETELLKENLEALSGRFDMTEERLNQIEQGVTADNSRMRADLLVVWLTDVYGILQEAGLTQARARLESFVLPGFNLDSAEAFQLALTHRLDLMNNRASLVDTWRLIEFNANALRSNLTVSLSGDISTARNNPVSFRSPTGRVTGSVQFDAPFTRLLERNNYRQSLIDYQRDRRQLIQFEDSIHQTLRSLLRLEEQHRTNLEIQRRAVAISIRRVDLTREELSEPVPPPEPGQPAPQFGPTAALNLLTALSDLRDTQNNFMSVWLNHYATRMRIMRELGLMRLDEEGRWIDEPLPDFEQMDEESEVLPTPPGIPEAWVPADLELTNIDFDETGDE